MYIFITSCLALFSIDSNNIDTSFKKRAGSVDERAILSAASFEEVVQQQAQKFISSWIRPAEREEIIDALMKVNPADLSSVVKYAPLLITDDMSADERVWIIQTLISIPTKEHGSAIAQLNKLIFDTFTAGAERGSILKVLVRINTEDRKRFVQEVRRLLSHNLEGFEILSILLGCENLYSKEGIKPFPIFVKRVKQLLNRTMSPSERNVITCEFTDVPSAQYKSFVKQIKQLKADTMDNRIFLKVILSLKKVSEAERPERIEETLRNLEATREKDYLADDNIGLYTLGYLTREIKSPDHGKETLAKLKISI